MLLKKIGLWIDHRNAHILTLKDNHVEMETVEAEVPGRPRARGGARSKKPFGPQDVVSEDRLQRKYESNLKKFYKSVADKIKHADRIYIFGPGQAKHEMAKLLDEKKDNLRIMGIEKMDSMTESEMKMQVKAFFLGEAYLAKK